MQLEPFEQDRYERLVATVFLDDLNVNAELVRLGHAWAYRRYMRNVEDAYLCELEYEARVAKHGLWSLPAKYTVAPWEWRKRKNLEYVTDYSKDAVANCVAAIGVR